MQVEVKEREESKELKFPKLMKTVDNDIVFFEINGSGTVIRHSDYICGHYSSNWYMPHFKDFKGSITLTQQ